MTAEWDRLVEAYGAEVTDLARKLAEWMILQSGESAEADALLVEIVSTDPWGDAPAEPVTPEQAREALVASAAIDVVWYFEEYFNRLLDEVADTKAERARRKVVDVVETL